MNIFLLIDANSIIHRAYHALPPLTAPDGHPTGALYGVARILSKIIAEKNPTYAAAAFDRPEPTFRKKEFGDYKGQRPQTPDDLAVQIREAKNLFKMSGIKTFDYAGFEADDIIGTLAKKFSKNVQVLILTGDLDSLQLVSKDISVETFKKGVSETITYTPEKVVERFGVLPEQITDYKGLVGDPSDNIPGVRGTGPKTASALISKYGSVENIMKERTPDSKIKNIQDQQNSAIASKKLATIDCNVPINTALAEMTVNRNMDELENYFAKFGFTTLIKNKKTAGIFKTEEKTAEEIDGITVGYDLKSLAKTTPIKEPLFDIKIAYWLINSDERNGSIDEIFDKFCGNEKDLKSAYKGLKTAMSEAGLIDVFNKIEMPLIPVLSSMEKTGISVEKDKLEKLETLILIETEKIAKNIYKLAGETFNINSPAQVSRILFNKLGIQPEKKKKNKTGALSTAESALSELKEKHEIVGLILEYRENMKMVSTYIKPLMEFSENGNGIIHTTYIQTGTTTGRLSSEKPNLQNIPQESKWAKPIRECFISRDGVSFVSFDYSQLELRILAHISGDQKMKQAFFEGKDIHTTTAANIFNIPENEVTPAMRRIAKTINFGVAYGMGPRSFSRESGLSFEEANKFIGEYFSDFPALKEWKTNIEKEAVKNMIIRNENGRIRSFPRTKNQRILSEIERAAVNMPIQSLEADILKIAMRECFNIISKNKSGSSLILTIHDELIFEIPDDILESETAIFKKTMENCHKISVPLVVDVKKGKTLGDMQKYKPNDN